MEGEEYCACSYGTSNHCGTQPRYTLCVLSPQACTQGFPHLADVETEAPQSAQEHTANQRSSGRPIQVRPAPVLSGPEGSWIMSPQRKCPVLGGYAGGQTPPLSVTLGVCNHSNQLPRAFQRRNGRQAPNMLGSGCRTELVTPSRGHLAMRRPQKAPSLWAGRATQDLR